MTIKYRYALNQNNNTVDVFQLDKTTIKEQLYTCLGCGNQLIPVLGKQVQKHFRHKHQGDCCPETYLHKLAKQKFFDIYSNCINNNIPFLINFHQEHHCKDLHHIYSKTCKVKCELKSFNLVKYFNQIYLEKKEGSFIPDLLLVSKTGEKLFLEIAVTHYSSEEKLKSNYRIIELEITNEDDTEIINSKKLTEGGKVKFINFNSIVEYSCQKKCKFKLGSSCEIKNDYFVIYQNGSSKLLKTTLSRVESMYLFKTIKYKRLVPFNTSFDDPTCNFREEVYKDLVVDSYFKKLGIKNCLLCRYHRNNIDFETQLQKPIRCNIFKRNFDFNKAAYCQYYLADTKAFD